MQNDEVITYSNAALIIDLAVMLYVFWVMKPFIENRASLFAFTKADVVYLAKRMIPAAMFIIGHAIVRSYVAN